MAQIARQRQQAGIAAQLVGRQQAAQHSYGDLEILDVDIPVEGQLRVDQFPSPVGLVPQVHEDERVQCVDGGHEQRLAVPVSRGPAERLKLVVTPGIALVVPVGMQEFLLDLSRQPLRLAGVHVGGRWLCKESMRRGAKP